MVKCLLVGVGGGIGAILRYLIGLIPVGAQNNFPIKTLLINVIGAFVIGLISVLAEKYQVSPFLVLPFYLFSLSVISYLHYQMIKQYKFYASIICIFVTFKPDELCYY